MFAAHRPRRHRRADLDEAIGLLRRDVRAGARARGGQRGAGRPGGDARRRRRRDRGVQLLAPLRPDSTIAKFLDRSGPGCSRWRTRSTTSTAAARPCANAACGCSTTSRAAAPPARGSTSCTPRTPAACWSSWSSPPPTRRVGVATSVLSVWSCGRTTLRRVKRSGEGREVLVRLYGPSQVVGRGTASGPTTTRTSSSSARRTYGSPTQR